MISLSSTSNIFIGDGMAPAGLSNKCLMLPRSKYTTKPIVEVNGTSDHWVISMKSILV
jgi:penicillin V acylase-like amidase (Ntn superfamily)